MTNTELTTIIASIICAMFASGGFWQFIQHKTQKKQPLTKACIEPLENAMLALLRDRLLHILSSYANEKTIEHDEFETLNALYKSYIILGGNGTIKLMYEQFEKRIIVSNEK